MKKEDVDKMTLQEAADYAVKAMVKQGKRSINLDAQCVYGSERGHCAVGHLLDKDNDHLMGYIGSVNHLWEYYEQYIPKLIGENLKFFEHLQGFHDAMSELGRRLILSRLVGNFPATDTSGAHWKAWIELGKNDE